MRCRGGGGFPTCSFYSLALPLLNRRFKFLADGNLSGQFLGTRGCQRTAFMHTPLLTREEGALSHTTSSQSLLSPSRSHSGAQQADPAISLDKP